MCCSFLGQLLYGTIMLVTLGLTLAAMFSPGWTEIRDAYNDDVGQMIQHPKGLFAFLCGGSDSLVSAQCRDWFNNLPGWERAVVVLLSLSVVAEVLALLWTVFTICACCCKKYVIHPLPVLAVLLAIFLAIALILFGVNNKDIVENFARNNYISQLGYSFYLGCGALAGAVIDVIVGGLTVALAQKDL